MRALVIDDHPLIHEIMPAVLRKALGEVTVATQSTLEAGLAHAAGSVPPDLVLLDLGLPGCEGIDALTRFRMEFPQLPVVVISANSDRESILGVLDSGANGFIPKTSKPEVIVAALRLVAAGGVYVPPEAIEDLAVQMPLRTARESMDLTERQRDVLRLILKGYNNERIASELAIAPNTVKQHAHAIFVQLGVSSRAEAVVAAANMGLRLG
ncbi:MAG TPA: response regulator transcription factor [Burkholderiales bacterium]|nr:response regulator transcription factor [Burkholderiales bacterium]